MRGGGGGGASGAPVLTTAGRNAYQIQGATGLYDPRKRMMMASGGGGGGASKEAVAAGRTFVREFGVGTAKAPDTGKVMKEMLGDLPRANSLIKYGSFGVTVAYYRLIGLQLFVKNIVFNPQE
jgi:hypothetical protein